ncbi:MAG: imelysin family protein, partial [Leptospiraceae bacterium]|nr:imelysin family protein [Leptospiraceae bacterium]
MRTITFIIILFFSFSNCSEKKGEKSGEAGIFGYFAYLFNSFNAKPLFKNLSENIIYTSYVDLEQKTTVLKNSIDSLQDNCSSNTGNLLTLQNQWKEVFYSLKKSEVIQFGPSSIYTSLDSWPSSYQLNPPNTTSINTFISGTETIDETVIATKSGNETGLPAIEFLLFDNGTGSSDAASICLSLSGRKLSYLKEIMKLNYNRIANLLIRWNPKADNSYSLIMQTAGDASNTTYKTEKELLDLLIKQIVNLVETIKDSKLGYPTGISVDSAGVIRSTNVESRFSNLSISDIEMNLSGLQQFYTGGTGEGLSTYVSYYNPDLDKRIQGKMSEAITQTKAIINLSSDISTGNISNIKNLIKILNELKILLT